MFPAFDISKRGKKKADQLALDNQVMIDYKVGELQQITFDHGPFDAIALIYAHFPAKIKSVYHRTLDQYLIHDGLIIFEAFSKKHIDHVLKDEKVGGPKDVESLFSEEIKSDFSNYEIIMLEEIEIELHEGLYHNGKGSVIRFVGKKPTEHVSS